MAEGADHITMKEKFESNHVLSCAKLCDTDSSHNINFASSVEDLMAVTSKKLSAKLCLP